MLAPRFIPFVAKQVYRHPTRTALTLAGVAVAMFLFVAVRAMQAGVREATETAAGDTTLIVYRQNRFCPATSRLPEYYGDRIAAVPGVAAVTPMKIVVNNCRTSLDVVTFRGVPEDKLVAQAEGFDLLSGSVQQWQGRSDAALVGDVLAARRGWKVGDRFDAAGVVCYVAGVIRSAEPQDRNVAYVHLPFLQRAADKRLGLVTQFVVKVKDANQIEQVARAIDAEFATAPDPTSTSPEKAFVARAAADVVRIVGFTQWLGWACLAAVLALVANAIVLAVQDRVREHAVLQTLGYTGGLIGQLVVAEGLLLGLLGGAIGAAAAWAVVHYGKFSLSTEGLSVQMTAGAPTIAAGLAVSAALGLLAGVVPAIRAARREIAGCFRAV